MDFLYRVFYIVRCCTVKIIIILGAALPSPLSSPPPIPPLPPLPPFFRPPRLLPRNRDHYGESRDGSFSIRLASRFDIWKEVFKLLQYWTPWYQYGLLPFFWWGEIGIILNSFVSLRSTVRCLMINVRWSLNFVDCWKNLVLDFPCVVLFVSLLFIFSSLNSYISICFVSSRKSLFSTWNLSLFIFLLLNID